MTVCNDLSPLSALCHHSFTFSSTQRWSCFNLRPADNCVLCFTSHAVLPSVKTLRWYLGNCRQWGRAPDSTRAPRVIKGRDVMMCQPASHHVWLPARRRSPAKSVYIIDRMEKQQMQSDAVCTLGHNGDYRCVMFSRSCSVCDRWPNVLRMY